MGQALNGNQWCKLAPTLKSKIIMICRDTSTVEECRGKEAGRVERDRGAEM